MWGYFHEKKQSAALTLEAGIMNFLVLNPQVIPHRTGPSRRVLLGSRKNSKKLFYFFLPLLSVFPSICVCWVVDVVEIFFFLRFFYPYQYFRRYVCLSVCLLGSRSSRKKEIIKKKISIKIFFLIYPYYHFFRRYVCLSVCMYVCFQSI